MADKFIKDRLEEITNSDNPRGNWGWGTEVMAEKLVSLANPHQLLHLVASNTLEDVLKSIEDIGFMANVYNLTCKLHEQEKKEDEHLTLSHAYLKIRQHLKKYQALLKAVTNGGSPLFANLEDATIEVGYFCAVEDLHTMIASQLSLIMTEHNLSIDEVMLVLDAYQILTEKKLMIEVKDFPPIGENESQVHEMTMDEIDELLDPFNDLPMLGAETKECRFVRGSAEYNNLLEKISDNTTGHRHITSKAYCLFRHHGGMSFGEIIMNWVSGREELTADEHWLLEKIVEEQKILG